MNEQSDVRSLRTMARHTRDRALSLGVANALVWGTLRVRMEHNAGQWRLALARSGVPPTVVQRKLIGAAFGLSEDAHWECGDLVRIAGEMYWTVAVEWGESKPVELSYIAKLQVLIGQIIDRWQRTGQRPPHPPSHIAAYRLVKNLDCDWETGKFFPVKGGETK